MGQKRTNCEQCEAPLPTGKTKGKPRRYCSDACKMAAHRKSAAAKKEQKECEHCGAPFAGKGASCSDRCFYHANKHTLPVGKEHLRAWDEQLVPWIPKGQIAAHDANRPDWHRWVYGGAVWP